MTPEEALAMLDNVVAQVQMNRADHVRVQTALKVISEAIKPKGKAPKKPD